MAKTNKTTPVVIGIVLIAAAGGYLVYRSKRNAAEGEALLAFINASVDETNATKAANDQIKAMSAVKVDPNRIKIGTLSGKSSDQRIRDLLAKTNVGIASAMQGAGTDTIGMLNALKNIKSKNTLAFIDKVFKAQYKEGIFEMMQGEKAFFSQAFCKYSEKTNTTGNQMIGQMFPIVAATTGCWAPWIAEWIYRLPEY